MYNPSSSQQWSTIVINKPDSKVKHTQGSSFNKSNSENHIDSVLAGEGSSKTILQTVGKEFGAKVLNFRLGKKMKQQELASAMNIPLKDLTEIEKGVYIKNGPAYSKVTRYINREYQKK
jgi:ribosome-binding protein aMBF1 (putative translation factor)